MTSEPVPATLPPNAYNEHAWIVGDPEIGDGTWIGPFTHLDGSGGLRIGSGCDISTGAQIYTHSTARRCVSASAYNTVDRASTTLGNHVFVGAGAVILMGVTIGDCAVIGAGAVVTGDVAPYTVVGGVPARLIARVVLDGGEVRFESVAGETESAGWT
jgi:acetyltransferase-like isoleucine patch superfamily enzyme